MTIFGDIPLNQDSEFDFVRSAGKAIIATEESRTNTAYGTLTTPDQVTVELPTDGLLAVAYSAMFKSSVAGAARAAIFLNSNQLQIATDQDDPYPQNAFTNPTAADRYGPLASSGGGLVSPPAQGAAYIGGVATGQVVGIDVTGSASTYAAGPCYIFANAGSYVVSVQFKASSGSVTVKERKLWVWSLSF
jgi:hypothetical protein